MPNVIIKTFERRSLKMHEYVKYFIDLIFGVAMFINAMLFIPQFIALYKTKNSRGLSLITFAGFNLIQLATIFHGYLYKDYILMYGYILTLFIAGSVTLLILLYRKNNISKA
jgi:MtN3 and saliva related transmembrane protein